MTDETETDKQGDDRPDEELHPAQLSARREMFAQQYVIDFNGARAARESGYSKKRADAAANSLLARADVQARIRELNEDRLQALGVTRDKITRELAAIAFMDPADILTWDGHKIELRDSKTLTRTQRAAIAEVSHTREGIKVKFHSKESALTTLARIASMLTDNINMRGDGKSFPKKMVVEFLDATAKPEQELPSHDGDKSPETENPGT